MTDQGAFERARALFRDWMTTRPEGVYQASIMATEAARLTEMIAAALTAAASEARAAPIPMILFCPACGVQHVDADNPNWDNPPHKTHRCESCGHLWRPAAVATEGVADLALGTGDTQPAIRSQTEARGAAITQERERIHAEFGIPMLILNGQAKSWQVTEADKAWADKVITERALVTPAQSETPADSKEATHRRFYEAFHAWFMQSGVDFWSEADAPEALATIAVEIYDRGETAQSEGK